MEVRKRRRRRKRTISSKLYALAVIIFIASTAMYAITAVAFLLNTNLPDKISEVAFYLLLTGVIICVIAWIISTLKGLFKALDIDP